LLNWIVKKIHFILVLRCYKELYCQIGSEYGRAGSVIGHCAANDTVRSAGRSRAFKRGTRRVSHRRADGVIGYAAVQSWLCFAFVWPLSMFYPLT